MKPADTYTSTKLQQFSQQQHAMLLYRTIDEEDAITRYVDEALSSGHLTVYLPLKTTPSPQSESIDYGENMNQGNLLTFDTRTFYNFALAGDMQPFEELKVLVEEAIEEQEKRIASKIKEKDVEEEEKEANVILVAGVAAELVRSGKFDEAVKLEEWWQKTYSEWQQKGLRVIIICPHLGATLDKEEIMHYKQAISSLHDITIQV